MVGREVVDVGGASSVGAGSGERRRGDRGRGERGRGEQRSLPRREEEYEENSTGRTGVEYVRHFNIYYLVYGAKATFPQFVLFGKFICGIQYVIEVEDRKLRELGLHFPIHSLVLQVVVLS